jgi:CRISPR system Cascade subunit CasD
VAEFLVLCFDAPLQAWGGEALDPRRPTRPFPSRSALAGLIANALGWRHGYHADRTTKLQDALRYAVREERVPRLLRDYQTADLGAIGLEGWTRWGIERRGGSVPGGTQPMEKTYLADGRFRATLGLAEGTSVPLDQVADALRRPARPLFLGRKGCPPAAPIMQGRISGDTPLSALRSVPLPPDADAPHELRVWFDPAHEPDAHLRASIEEVWDRRDYAAQRFLGSRRVARTTWNRISGRVT